MTSSPQVEDRLSYTTEGGIHVVRDSHTVVAADELPQLARSLDCRRGVLLSSGYDYPGRYTRWDLGFVDPPLSLTARSNGFAVAALNERGKVLLPAVRDALSSDTATHAVTQEDGVVRGTIVRDGRRFPEEERSRQPSLFSVIRALRGLFAFGGEHHLGLYGAFGYDLCFQFEPIELRLKRPEDQRDLLLYLPDSLLVVDRQKEVATRFNYEFSYGGQSTHGLARTGAVDPYVPAPGVESRCDHAPGEYAAAVERARTSFKCGDLFELVLSQCFHEPCADAPSVVFERLQERNPAPYALLLNLGEGEYLVGASPEMYVRSDGREIETCPISGTIPRGGSAVEDAERILELLSSTKDESELTMCTDVDRNDKSRICEPGSVRVVGRRQIELYSRLIHTVDHVKGTLRPEFDALDAFLSHTWAVTVTGAPKPAAIARLEQEEKTPRAWYGGAIGVVGFDGGLNTGLTLRTIRLKNGAAELRAGATLLYDSDPEAEERETRVKASAFIDAIKFSSPATAMPAPGPQYRGGHGVSVLLVDHEDSFVHTLANYFRQTGARVVTLRAGFEESEIDRIDPNLVVLSPGPGTPSDFNLKQTIGWSLRRQLSIFGVCLGLQGLVEYFGGQLGVLDYPMHGKPSIVRHKGGMLFKGLPDTFQVGRYHSLFAKNADLPSVLRAVATTEDDVIMAIEHESLPIAAVQFHPESILTLSGEIGLRLIDNALGALGPKS